MIVNAAFPDEDGNGVSDSVDVGRYYAEQRQIPPGQILYLKTLDYKVIPYTRFILDVVNPIVEHLEAGGEEYRKRILYLVPVYGMPIKVRTGFSSRDNPFGKGQSNNERSVDAYLNDLYKVYRQGLNAPLNTTLNNNPYSSFYRSNRGKSFKEVREEDPLLFGEYFLVTRLDGASSQVARELVDRALYAETWLHDPAHPTQTEEAGYYSGRAYWDRESSGSGTAGIDRRIHQARLHADAAGWITVVEDTHDREFGEEGHMPEPITSYPLTDILWYYGWYSCGPYRDIFRWKVGAIGIHLDSCSAADIRDGDRWVAGALRRGITATAGSVNEPFATLFTMPDRFFEHLFSGQNFADAAWYATNADKWMMVMVGDPLYRPYIPGKSVQRDTTPPRLLSAEGLTLRKAPESSRTVQVESDKLCLFRVHYGTGGRFSLLTPWTDFYTRRNTLSLTGLAEGMTYEYRVEMEDPVGNRSLSETMTIQMQ